jgi:UDP-N-acetylmuramoyl-L-alanyl-D-glutamate--2,6-diaminopimelate ligase
MTQSGVNLACIEASSHALDQDRLAGIPVHIGVFTNLTQDHLDYHRTMEDYFQAKAKLFAPTQYPAPRPVLNLDDAFGRRLFESLPQAIGFGLLDDPPPGCLTASIASMNSSGLRLRCTYQGHTWEVSSPLVGRHNASNLLAAQAAGLAYGLSRQHVSCVGSVSVVPGRLEQVPDKAGRHVFVDYAHTPDALEQVCSALSRVGFSRLIVLFGCGGDRDASKRPLMAQAVAHHAQTAVLTSDNPRSEDPLAIMAQAGQGLKECPQVIEEPDRAKAIAAAVNMLSPGDALLIAGKGHETYQEIKGQRKHFNDAELAAEALARTAKRFEKPETF